MRLLEFFVSHDASLRKSFPRYISASHVVMYIFNAVGVTKVKHRQIKSSLPTIVMHVDTIFVFAWMRWYAASRSVFQSGCVLKSI